MTAAYHLQLTSDFGFDGVEAPVPYLKALGVPDVYRGTGDVSDAAFLTVVARWTNVLTGTSVDVVDMIHQY